MGNMRFKVGDRVRIKSIDWYNENKDDYGYVWCTEFLFTPEHSKYCGRELTISHITEFEIPSYVMESNGHDWTAEMIEGLVERNGKTYPYKIGDRVVLKGNHRCATITDLKYNSSGNLSYYIKIDNDKDISTDCPTDLLLPYDNVVEGLVEEEVSYDIESEWLKHETSLPEGYIFKDENGNVINATKIVLEKKSDDKLKLESTKKVREYWSEYTRIFIEIYEDEPNECVLTHLYTLEGHRQKGYAKKALAEAELIAKELGCHKAHLKVETNSWMHNWYLRCGYQWYKNANEGYTWLTKNL